MIGPPSLKNEPASLLPGGVTYVADPNGQSFRPAIDVRPNLGALAADIAEVQGRIKEAFYANLFLMLEGRVSPAGRGLSNPSCPQSRRSDAYEYTSYEHVRLSCCDPSSVDLPAHKQ